MHSLTKLLSHALTHSLTDSLTHSLNLIAHVGRANAMSHASVVRRRHPSIALCEIFSPENVMGVTISNLIFLPQFLNGCKKHVFVRLGLYGYLYKVALRNFAFHKIIEEKPLESQQRIISRETFQTATSLMVMVLFQLHLLVSPYKIFSLEF